MAASTQLLRLFLICAATFVVITGCVAWFPGVWLPDIGGRVSELCTAESGSGDKFRVTQFWGDDFYTIRFDHQSSDGSSHTQVIEGDAMKHWRRCAMRMDERDKALFIDLHDGYPLIHYRWAEKKFVMPPGWQRLRP